MSRRGLDRPLAGSRIRKDGPVTTPRVFGRMPDGRDVPLLTIGSAPGPVVEVRVATHDRGNSLHGGPDGFDVRLWDVVEHGPDHVVLTMTSPDGEGAGTVDDHLLQVEADAFTPVDATGIPLGDHAPVAGTPFDFRRPAPVGPAVRSDHPQVALAHGIDHNFVVRGTGLRRAAVLASPGTRTSLELWTDQPGLQVYTGNFLDGTRRSTGGGRYRQGDGIALEPQLFPDSPHRPEWPSAELRPGATYVSVLEWRFGRP